MWVKRISSALRCGCCIGSTCAAKRAVVTVTAHILSSTKTNQKVYTVRQKGKGSAIDSKKTRVGLVMTAVVERSEKKKRRIENEGKRGARRTLRRGNIRLLPARGVPRVVLRQRYIIESFCRVRLSKLYTYIYTYKQSHTHVQVHTPFYISSRLDIPQPPIRCTRSAV